jgi:hypothetical protein
MQREDIATAIVLNRKTVLAPLQADVAALKARLAATIAEQAGFRDSVTGVRERLAVIESRPPLAGPPGQDGAPGPPGPPGKPGLESKGDWHAGESYDTGDLVRYRSAIWICEQDGTIRLPGDGSGAWKLWIKPRDGKDGKDGKDAA